MQKAPFNKAEKLVSPNWLAVQNMTDFYAKI